MQNQPQLPYPCRPRPRRFCCRRPNSKRMRLTSLATLGDSQNSASTLGITMKKLKVSASSHISGTSTTEIYTTSAMTSSRYALMGPSPKR